MFESDFGLGTLISNLSNTYGTGATLAKKKEEDRREGEMWNTQWSAGPGLLARVEGAKAAGLHPLAALGLPSSGMSSPVVSSDSPVPRFSFSGEKREDPAIARYNDARARLASSEADMAELNYRNAVARLASQPGQPSLYNGGASPGRGGGLVVPESDQFRFPGLRGAVSVEAMKIPSASNASRAVTAGDVPGWQPYRFTDGVQVMLPYAGEGQTFMGQSPVMGTLLALPQYLLNRVEALGSVVAERGVRDRAAFKSWWRDPARWWNQDMGDPGEVVQGRSANFKFRRK